jgi:hypothetical protein
MAGEEKISFNPCAESLSDEEQVVACRWELLKRNPTFRTVSNKWIQSKKFRKTHVLTPEYRHFIRMVPCCVLDWMLTPQQRVELAQFQIGKLTWKCPPRLNFGAIVYQFEDWDRLSRENRSNCVKYVRPMENPPKPIDLSLTWDQAPEPFKQQFKIAVGPPMLKPAFVSMNLPLAELARKLVIMAKKLRSGDKPNEIEGMAQYLFDTGQKLGELCNYRRLYGIGVGEHSSKRFKGYVEQIEKDLSGMIFDARKYDRNRSYLGTNQDWRWFLEAESHGLDIDKPADLYKLATHYSEDIRHRAMRGKAPKGTLVHGHTGAPFSSKTIKNRRSAAKRHVLKIREWIQLVYPSLPPGPPRPVF